MRPVISIEYEGDKHVAMQYLRQGRALLNDCETHMKFRELKQFRMTREVSPDITIKVWSCFFHQHILIQTPTPGGVKPRGDKPYCFANRTVALAEILSVDGVPVSDVPTCEPDMVCGTCMTPDQYPAEYYCTKDITYTLEVCDIDDNYLFFEGIPSTDFTPHCPGERVLVVLHLTEETPSDVLVDAESGPCAESFTFPSIFFTQGIKSFSILPFVADIVKHDTQEDYSYTQ